MLTYSDIMLLIGKREDAETDKGGQHEIERLQSAVKPKHWSFGSKDDMSPELYEIVKEESKVTFNIHIYVCVYIYVCMYVYVRMYIHAYMRTYIHAYM